jgi:sec-independent protein translocase protein TatA
MPNIGPLEIAVVLIIVLIIFGPKRLPELGQSMGRGIREFRNSISGDKDKDSPDEKRRELEATQQVGVSQPAADEAPAKPAEPPDAPAKPAEPPKPAETAKPAEPVEGEIVTENKA